MESSTSKAQVIRPLLLKAGIPLVLSVAGFICARIIARKKTVPNASSVETTQVSSLETDSHKEFVDDDSFYSFNSTSSPLREDEEQQMIISTHFMNFIENSEAQTRLDYEAEILGLRNRIEELQKRECELEIQFFHYRVLKEQETVLVELKNMLLMKIACVEFLDREISLNEDETKRLEGFAVEYLRVLEQLECWKSKNGLLQRKAKKLLRKTKDQSKVIREKNLKIESREAEILRSREALETRTNVIRTLEDEVRVLQSTVDQLQEQKNELLKKLNSAENSASSISKIEADGITMEGYKQLVHELEQLKKDRAAELTELIYLRWSNACLRHELMGNYGQQKQIDDEKNYLELEFEGNGETGDCEQATSLTNISSYQNEKQQAPLEEVNIHQRKPLRDYLELQFEGNGETGDCVIEQQLDGLVLEHGESSLGLTTGGHACPKPRNLLHKFKKWVEGSEKMKSKLDDKERHGIKFFGRHSVSDIAEKKHHFHARKSYSA